MKRINLVCRRLKYTMKRIVLLLIVVLSSCVLSAQGQETSGVVKGKKVGDIVKGKRVKYMMVGEGDYSFEVKNVKNRDTVKRKENIHIPKSMKDKIYEVVYNALSPEILSRCIKEKYEALDLKCIMNKKFMVEEITFLINKEGRFWSNFPVDQLYRIEREIIKNVEIDVRERVWVTKEEIEKQYFVVSIQPQVLRVIRIRKAKEAEENAKLKSSGE